MEAIEFELTLDQIEKLRPLITLVEDYNTEKNPNLDQEKAPAIIAQLLIVQDMADPRIMVGRAGFLPNDKATQIYNILISKGESS